MMASAKSAQGRRLMLAGVYSLLLGWCLLWLSVAQGQTASAGGVESTTQDRLEDPGWWPTKGDPPRAAYAGNASCAECHASFVATQKTTPMAAAGSLASQAELLRRYTPLLLEMPPYTYRIAAGEMGPPSYTASDGKEIATAALGWAFGSGEMGQTYVYQQDGGWAESRVSLYAKLGRLDITTGHSRLPPESTQQALGRRMTDGAARQCFACHTSVSTVERHFEPQHATGGVTCEACHGPGAAHAASAKAALEKPTRQLTASAIMNPALLSPVDSVDFCGACHRTWADIAFAGAEKQGLEVVRFQPYRLERSRCWGKEGDRRITCVACHDPHRPVERDSAAYDRQCLSCHRSAQEAVSAAKPGASCPRSANHCTTCHMPKVNVAAMHHDFTDHFIRIVREGEIFPE